jgi:hypothetical protein
MEEASPIAPTPSSMPRRYSPPPFSFLYASTT